jgi:hypothetical protein
VCIFLIYIIHNHFVNAKKCGNHGNHGNQYRYAIGDSDYILYFQDSIQYGLRITSAGYCSSGNHFGYGSNRAITDRRRSKK